MLIVWALWYMEMLFATAEWVRDTPFGFPVVPLEYGRAATRSRGTCEGVRKVFFIGVAILGAGMGVGMAETCIEMALSSLRLLRIVTLL